MEIKLVMPFDILIQWIRRHPHMGKTWHSDSFWGCGRKSPFGYRTRRITREKKKDWYPNPFSRKKKNRKTLNRKLLACWDIRNIWTRLFLFYTLLCLQTLTSSSWQLPLRTHFLLFPFFFSSSSAFFSSFKNMENSLFLMTTSFTFLLLFAIQLVRTVAVFWWQVHEWWWFLASVVQASMVPT